MKSLAELALVGLARAPNEALPGGPETAMVESLALELRERSLLLNAGVAAVRAKAGRKAARATPPAPAPPDTWTVASDALATAVADLLAEGPRGVIREALERMAVCQRRLPHALLPALLAARDDRLLPHATAVAGERGRWLVGLNPDWQWVLGVAEDRLPRDEMSRQWSTGTLTERELVLRKLRAEDAALARAWLEEVWKEEKADTRERLLRVLTVGLGSDDTAFLERVLSDRAASVRGLALRLLVRVPGSAVGQRMAERACEILAYTPTMRSGISGVMRALKSKLGGDSDAPGQLTVEPPEAFAPAWAAEGLQPRPPAGMGQKAFWMKQILGLVPPTLWEERFELSPAALVVMARKTEWTEMLLSAWLEAAVLFETRHWAMPLWTGLQIAPVVAGNAWSLSLTALQLMSPEEAETVACRMLLATPSGLATLAVHLPKPWGMRLAEAFFAAWHEAHEAAFADARSAWSWAEILPLAAEALPQPAFARALALPAPAEATATPLHTLPTAFQRFHQLITLRQRVYEETELGRR